MSIKRRTNLEFLASWLVGIGLLAVLYFVVPNGRGMRWGEFVVFGFMFVNICLMLRARSARAKQNGI